IVDFTNPVGIVVRGLLDAGHRAVGLCNVAIGVQRYAARMLDVEPERVLVDQVGLNHLTWVRGLHVDGDDVLPDLLAERVEELAESVDLPPSLLERLGVIPSYYLRYFYLHDWVLEEQRSAKPRAAEVAEIERELLGLVQHVAAYERLAARAAVTGERELVYKALLAHPLVGQAPQAERLTEELLAAGREHLPQFESQEAVR